MDRSQKIQHSLACIEQEFYFAGYTMELGIVVQPTSEQFQRTWPIPFLYLHIQNSAPAPVSTGVQSTITRTQAAMDGLPLHEQKKFFPRYARFGTAASDTRNYSSTIGPQTCGAGERKNDARMIRI
ncbi:MAG: hypothetical protein ACM3WS_00315 [Bacillota bacterium]